MTDDKKNPDGDEFRYATSAELFHEFGDTKTEAEISEREVNSVLRRANIKIVSDKNGDGND